MSLPGWAVIRVRGSPDTHGRARTSGEIISTALEEPLVPRLQHRLNEHQTAAGSVDVSFIGDSQITRHYPKD